VLYIIWEAISVFYDGVDPTKLKRRVNKGARGYRPASKVLLIFIVCVTTTMLEGLLLVRLL
jgi:hypothetical protein